jgi:hypothetical protein
MLLSARCEASELQLPRLEIYRHVAIHMYVAPLSTRTTSKDHHNIKVIK